MLVSSTVQKRIIPMYNLSLIRVKLSVYYILNICFKNKLWLITSLFHLSKQVSWGNLTFGTISTFVSDSPNPPWSFVLPKSKP